MKRLLTFTALLACSVRKSVNNVLASRRLVLEAREKRLALSATPIPCASPPTDNETLFCRAAQLDTDCMETIPIAAEALAAPLRRCSAGSAQTNENVGACNAVLADWSEDEDFFIEEAPELSAAVDSETTFGYGATDEFLACAALEEDDGEVPDDALGDGCGSGCGDGCGSGCGDSCGGDGCDAGCGNAVLSLALGAPGNMIAGCFDGTATNPVLELVVIQDPYGTVTVPASMTGSNESGYNFAITISNPGTYWNKSVGSSADTFVWTKPNNVTNAAATRDFTFNYIVYHDANNNGSYDDGETIAASESACLHIAYVEIEVSIAGEPFVPLTPDNNKAIVGQKIQARVAMDSRLSIPSNEQRTWSLNSNLGQLPRIKSYTTNEQFGVVDYLVNDDYHQEVIKFYEVKAQSTTIMCNVPLQWTPTGSIQPSTTTYSATTSIEIIAPSISVDAYISAPSPIGPDENNVTRLYGPGILILPSVGAVLRDGINNDAGEINFVQTVQDLSYKRRLDGYISNRAGLNQPHLDRFFPYYKQENVNYLDLSEWYPGTTSIHLAMNDRPSYDLSYEYENNYWYLNVDLRFMASTIYKPTGADSIWIPLQQVQWSWRCEATYDVLAGWIQSNVSYPLSYVLSPSLQEWNDNIRYYTNW